MLASATVGIHGGKTALKAPDTAAQRAAEKTRSSRCRR
jgi:hypothetical protein